MPSLDFPAMLIVDISRFRNHRSNVLRIARYPLNHCRKTVWVARFKKKSRIVPEVIADALRVRDDHGSAHRDVRRYALAY